MLKTIDFPKITFTRPADEGEPELICGNHTWSWQHSEKYGTWIYLDGNSCFNFERSLSGEEIEDFIRLIEIGWAMGRSDGIRAESTRIRNLLGLLAY